VVHNETPPILVNLVLTAVFAVASRWIKRNPSSFLKYALFPFGGLKVERWPRFMLVIVRVCAGFSFFFFLLAFIGLLAPGSVAHPTPAVLYSKFAFCIVASFFALRGTAEPVVDYETPGFAAPAIKPSTAPSAAPAAPQSRPAMKPSLGPGIAAAPPQGQPATPLSLASAPKATAKPVAAVSAPAASSAQNRLFDAEAPPVPNRSNPLCPPPRGVVKERLATIGSSFIMGAIFIGGSYLLGITWLVYAFLIFFSLAILILLSAIKAPVGACPFCGGLIERYNRLRPEPVCCEQCGEISKFENERFSPYDPATVSEKPIFRSALFENAIWPNGCVQCGAAPTRFDVAKGVRYQARRLATPLASSLFLPHPAAMATGVPYCAQHRDAIEVIPPKEMFAWTPWKYFRGFEERMEARRRASLLWRSLPMMRRYLEANRRAKSPVSTGYREPNLLQKTVSGVLAEPKSQGPGGPAPRTHPSKPEA
jgi:hypothetical protein